MSRPTKCHLCEHEFDAMETPFRKHIERHERRGEAECPVRCPNCNKFTKTSLMNGGGATTSGPYRCPVSRCVAWVSEVDGPGFWGCGECGSIWHEMDNLLAEITSIIEKFAYRKSCYMEVDGIWQPGDHENEVEGYASLVEQEPEDKGQDFVRG